MTASSLLGVIGISVSLLFGAWGVYLAIKHRYPGRVDFLREQSIALFDAIVKNLPDLAVLYKNAPVSPRLVLVKGALVNTGAIDISPSMVDLPITLSLPNGFKWLAGSIVSASENVDALLEIAGEGNLRITTGLYRCKEYIRFQALAEVAETELGHGAHDHSDFGGILLEAIEFNHRIANTRKIRKLDVQNPLRLRQRLRLALVILAVGVTFIAIFGGTWAWRGVPSELTYHYKPAETTYHVRITPHRDGRVSVAGIDSNYSVTTTLDEFFAKCEGRPTVSVARDIKVLIPVTLFTYMGLPLLYLLARYRQYRRNKKMYAALGLQDSDPDSEVSTGAI